MKDVMIDIETLGTSIDCIILSIAAVEFDRTTGETGREFYEKIDINQGRYLCFDTLRWWASQPSGAFAEALSGKRHISSVLSELARWFEKSLDTFVWSQGLDFDLPIIENAMSVKFVSIPWKYSAKRDTRTVYDSHGFDPKSIEREGVYHNALDDCKHQIKCVVAAMASRAVTS